MQIEKAISLVLSEISRAEEIHPNWPSDLVKAAAIVAEESGELIQAANNLDETPDDSLTPLITEAIHTAATALRFLKNIKD